MIRVDLIDTRPGMTGFGHPSWEIEDGGGRVEHNGVVVEVRPSVELPGGDGWRNWDQLHAIAAEAEGNGGFVRSGDEIHVGSHIVVGRDALELLIVMWKRANDRVPQRGATGRKEAYQQGRSDALRQARQSLDLARESLK